MNIKVSELAICLKEIELAKWKLMMQIENLSMKHFLIWVNKSVNKLSADKKAKFPVQYFWVNEFHNHSAICDIFHNFKSKNGGCFCPLNGILEDCFCTNDIPRHAVNVPEKRLKSLGFVLQQIEDVPVSKIMMYIKKLPFHKMTKKIRKINELWLREIRYKVKGYF